MTLFSAAREACFYSNPKRRTTTLLSFSRRVRKSGGPHGQGWRTHLQDGAPPVDAAGQRARRGRHSHQHAVAVHADAVGAVVVVRQPSAKLRTFTTNHLVGGGDKPKSRCELVNVKEKKKTKNSSFLIHTIGRGVVRAQ